MSFALVIGAGPAGLMAAESLGQAGVPVVIAEAMPTPARKFLMAGKSGLNLTKAEPMSRFTAHLPPKLQSQSFGPDQVRTWAQGLGIGLFTGSTGRVFPVGMKASPLLRAWLARLAGMGVELRPRWRWTGMNGGFRFDTPDGPQILHPGVTILALGGASWPRLGSDAAWVPILRANGVEITPFRPANMGFHVRWSDQMRRHFGAAVKGTAISAGNLSTRGEWVITAQGIEGGGIYEISAHLRDGAPGLIDLAPDLTPQALTERLSNRGKLSVGNWLRRALPDPVKTALLLEWGRPLPADAAAIARLIKSLPLCHDGPMPIERAISSAGGIAMNAITPDLELRALPGVFAAGEMLDWEAPTGGYLLTTCLGTGKTAGDSAARYLRSAF